MEEQRHIRPGVSWETADAWEDEVECHGCGEILGPEHDGYLCAECVVDADDGPSIVEDELDRAADWAEHLAAFAVDPRDHADLDHEDDAA